MSYLQKSSCIVFDISKITHPLRKGFIPSKPNPIMHFTVKYSKDWTRIYQIYDAIHHNRLESYLDTLQSADESKLKEAFDMIHSKESILLNFLKDDNRPPECSKILDLIPPLKETYWSHVSELFKKWAPQVEEKLNEFGKKADNEIERLFGVRPSPEFLVALSHNKASANSIHGQQLSNEPFLNMQITEGKPLMAHIDVAFHEVIHYVLRINGWKKKFKSDNLEEAFIKLIAPRGILSERLGIHKCEIAITEDKRCNKEIDFLRPHILEYYSSNSSGNILNFLERKKVL